MLEIIVERILEKIIKFQQEIYDYSILTIIMIIFFLN